MLRLALVLVLLLSLLAAAFHWSSSTRHQRADFTFINRGEIGTLDPNRMSWVQDIRVGYALWEGLYTLEPQTLKPIPGSADRIDISPDKKTYTFHIRENARWSNGDPLTSHDFVFAWRRMLEQPGDYTYLFHAIRGARSYQEAFAQSRKTGGVSPDIASVGIVAVDAKTLRVELEHPVAYFPDLCAFTPFWPLHQKSMEKFRDEATGAYSKGFTLPPHLVTNGPYRLESWTFREKLRLVANEHYWDRENVRSKSIDVLIGPDAMWAFLKYDSGAADWLSDAAGAIGAELFTQGRSDLHISPGFGTYLYKLNCSPTLPDGTKNPLADARVRRALSLAIDRTGIVKTITRLGERTASTFVPPGVFPGYQSPRGVELNVEEARRLLAEAGYPQGKGFPHIKITYNSEFHHGDVAQYVRRQWLETLGIDVGLEPLEIKVFRQKLHTTQYAIARASWTGDYNDVSTFLDCYRSDSDNNDTRWGNPTYDRLMDEAAMEPDQQRRLELFRQCEQILMDEQPIIPLYHDVLAYLFRDNVKGLYMHPRNMVMYKTIEVIRDGAAR